MEDRPPGADTTVLVTPIAPARTGNGLAMRASMLLEALAGSGVDAGPVDVVIVPVSGPAGGDGWLEATARRVVVVEPEVPGSRAEVAARLADPARRAELGALEGLPARVRRAPPSLVPGAVDDLTGEDLMGGGLREVVPSVVVVLRSYLAPFGVTLARALGAPRVVIDADDDDEALLRSRGDEREADEHARLARAWLARADRVLAASPADASAMTARYGFPVDTLPNAVRLPATVSDPPRRGRLLFVGNLTYAPNIDAVRDLVLGVLPAVRALVADASVDVIGGFDSRLADLAGDPPDGVHFAGAVPDLEPWYAGADVVVVPLREGAGTRIKVLEAFAHRRPVVATPAAVAGLDVADGRSVHLGTTPGDLAAHVVRLLGAPDDARRTTDEAEAVLSEHYRLDVVAPHARRLLLRP